jgi:hypothetical protein
MTNPLACVKKQKICSLQILLTPHFCIFTYFFAHRKGEEHRRYEASLMYEAAR